VKRTKGCSGVVRVADISSGDHQCGLSGGRRAHGHQEAGRGIGDILDYPFHCLCNFWCFDNGEDEAAAPDDAAVVPKLSQRPHLDCQLGDEPEELPGASDRVEKVRFFLLRGFYQISTAHQSCALL
jgi:hypothetical protein